MSSELPTAVDETGLTPSQDGTASIVWDLKALATYIEHARHEIVSIRAEEIAARFIPTASDELGAINQHLEHATDRILDSCETIEGLSGDLSQERAATMGSAITAIYEACNFQDLTGQRISKIVATLQEIERRISVLIARTDGMLGRCSPTEDTPAAAKEVPQLLNGPALPGQGVSQDDVDALIGASFG
ncbi:MAG TPA: protein phosphatase CheZ [Geminicoccus sp.]|jgi:chemotaxis protein CheZ|uniref:protein phosphatase CheZ n=1 Tax=Geminicoccus sp. TaxID=2024832 RepID=UPI002E30CE1C|nr:protein phosphatase CheZ [Geminicoccus sp.]HEX2524693.1 protein phosphatase CheZ [Geminicoccus sp.]